MAKLNEQEAITKLLIKEMNKGHDLPIAFSLNESNPTEVKDFISTGCTTLDYCIANRRNGGIPAGKLTEIVGEEASGKSLLATQILANTQKKGGIAVLFDTENAANPDFMKRVGLDAAKLVYMQPGCIEDCYETIEKIITAARAKDTECPVTIVWDSTAATPPRVELETSDYDPNSRIGLAAKAHAKGLRMLTKSIGYDKVTLVFCNQLKVKIGVMYGDPMTTPGGKAVPYHASIRIKLVKGKPVEEGESAKLKEHVGVMSKATVFKSRLGPPKRAASFNILFSSGVDDLSSIRDYLWEKRGFIVKAGGWMKMPGPDGKELKFRENEWASLMKDKTVYDYVLDKLEKFMVVTYDDEDVPDYDFDENSLLEVEGAIDE